MVANDKARELWVNNDEGLYLQWQAAKQPLRTFVRANRAVIDAAISKALAMPAAGKNT